MKLSSVFAIGLGEGWGKSPEIKLEVFNKSLIPKVKIKYRTTTRITTYEMIVFLIFFSCTLSSLPILYLIYNINFEPLYQTARTHFIKNS
ncbi:hypothetical protein CANDROIZ_370002 [Candidatus Roizmanbacteria bacterium]|nr:hypothetical protein CANDROIZ_370002 [Candidatus Roizmanbacteria bacterium]